MSTYKKRQVNGSFRAVSRQTQQVGGNFNGYKKKEGGKAVSPTPLNKNIITSLMIV